MKNLTELKKYPMTEAIYIRTFDIPDDDLKNKPREGIIADYEHLEENVEEALETLSEMERFVLRRVLDEKKTLDAVGEEIGKSGTRVGQLINKAFHRLRHPVRTRILDGSQRMQRIEAEAKEKRENAMTEKWLAVGMEIERRKNELQALIDAKLECGLDMLQLTTECDFKLSALGVATIGDLLERFPYDSRTNGLTGLIVAEGIEKTDYQEIWCALFAAGLLIRMPEPPDFDALKKAEQAAILRDDTTKILSMDIADLELSVRSYSCLKRGGINSVDELLRILELNPDEFLKMNGQKTAKAIDSLLQTRNLGRRGAEEVVSRLREVLNGDF